MEFRTIVRCLCVRRAGENGLDTRCQCHSSFVKHCQDCAVIVSGAALGYQWGCIDKAIVKCNSSLYIMQCETGDWTKALEKECIGIQDKHKADIGKSRT